MNPDLQRRPRQARVLAALLLGGIGLLTACGGQSQPAPADTAIKPGAGQSLAGSVPSGAPATSGSPMPGMSMPGTPPAGGGGAQAPAGAHAVAIKNFAFAPATLTVPVGTTVTWTNQDTDPHTVTSQGNGGPLNSKALTTGQSFSYTFTKAGTYSYLCTIHPFMTATVRVTQ